MTSAIPRKESVIIGVVAELTAGKESVDLQLEVLNQGGIKVLRGGMLPGQKLSLGPLLERDDIGITPLDSMRRLSITELYLEMRQTVRGITPATRTTETTTAFQLGISDAWSVDIDGEELFSVDKIFVDLRTAPQETSFFLLGKFSLFDGAGGLFELSVRRIVSKLPPARPIVGLPPSPGQNSQTKWEFAARAKDIDLKRLIDRFFPSFDLESQEETSNLAALKIKRLDFILTQTLQPGKPTLSTYRFFGQIFWNFSIGGQEFEVDAAAIIQRKLAPPPQQTIGSPAQTPNQSYSYVTIGEFSGTISTSIPLFETLRVFVAYRFEQTNKQNPPRSNLQTIQPTYKTSLRFGLSINDFALEGQYENKDGRKLLSFGLKSMSISPSTHILRLEHIKSKNDLPKEYEERNLVCISKVGTDQDFSYYLSVFDDFGQIISGDQTKEFVPNSSSQTNEKSLKDLLTPFFQNSSVGKPLLVDDAKTHDIISKLQPQLAQLNPGSVSLGQLISYVVSLFDSGLEDFELDPPWDVIGKQVINFSELKIELDLTSKRFGISYNAPLDFQLFKIYKIGLSYQRTSSSTIDRAQTSSGKVQIQLEYDFPAVPGPRQTTAWDPVNETAPTVPAEGVTIFDLQFLALGQRVNFHPAIVSQARNISQVMTVLRQTMGVPLTPIQRRQNPLEALQARLGPAPVSIDPTAPITLPEGANPIVFNPSSGILLGAQFSIMDTLDMSVIFNDPLIYGLRISLYGAKAKLFSGLQFEILYRKVSDTVGVYHIELALPDAMRQFDVGALAVTLPTVVVDIYTNGDFAIDFGFPWKGDFSRSFIIEGFAGPFPVLGAGGFYFAKLSAETATSTPPITNGNFSPVYEFGLGLKIGLGRTFNKGVLKAEISITIQGVIQGVVARFNPKEPDVVPADDYFKIQGGVSLVGRLYGLVDFGVISVDVEVLLRATVLFVVEAYKPTEIILEAEVSVRASVKIAFIRVRFSFNLTLRQSFTIGSAQTPPWIEGQPEAASFKAASMAQFIPSAPEPVRFEAAAFEAATFETTAFESAAFESATLEATAFETVEVEAVEVVAVEDSLPVSRSELIERSSSVEDASLREEVVTTRNSDAFSSRQPLSSNWFRTSFTPPTNLGLDQQSIYNLYNLKLLERTVTIPVEEERRKTFNEPGELEKAALEALTGELEQPFQTRKSLILIVKVKLQDPKAPSNNTNLYKVRVFDPQGVHEDFTAPPNQTLFQLLEQAFKTKPNSHAEEQELVEDVLEILLRRPSDNRIRIDLYFQPGFTKTNAQVKGVGLLFIENSVRSDDPKKVGESAQTVDTDFDQLIKMLLRWAIRSYRSVHAINTDGEMSLADWQELYDCFIEEFKTADNIPNFLTHLESFLKDNFVFDISDRQLSDPDQTKELSGAFFPMLPKIGMTLVETNDSKTINFQDNAYKHDLEKIKQIKSYFQELREHSIKSNEQGTDTITPIVRNSDMSDDLSLSEYLFADYFLLLIRSGLQSAIDLLEDPKTPSSMPINEVLNTLNSNGAFNQLAGTASRYFLHGLRLPDDPEHKASSNTALYEATGQQFDISITPAAQGKESTVNLNQIILTNPNKLNWIRFIDYDRSAINTPPKLNNEQLNYDLQASQKAFLIALQEVRETDLGLEQNYRPHALPFYEPASRRYNLRHRSSLKNKELRELPAELRAYLQDYDRGLSFVISLATDKDALPIEATVTWCTKVKFTIKQIGTSNIYELVGTDEAGKDVLEAIRAEGQKTILDLLYLGIGEDTESASSILVSTTERTIPVSLLKTNLSTRSVSGSSRAARRLLQSESTGDNQGFQANLSDGNSFLQILWECSTVNSGGYYLDYGQAPAVAPLPDKLFTDGVTADLVLLIQVENRKDQAYPFHNCVQINRTFENQDLVATRESGDPIQVLQLSAGHIGLQLQRPQLEPDDASAVDDLSNLYQLLGYRIAQSESFNSSVDGLPIGPRDDNEQWLYERVIPAYKFAKASGKGNGTLPADLDPYRGVGSFSHLEPEVEWRDVYGNIFTKYTADAILVRYFDSLVGLNQWPGLMERYQFAPDETNKKAKLTIYLQLDLGQYMPKSFKDLEEARTKIQAALDSYRQIFYQIHQDDVVVTVQTSVLLKDGEQLQQSLSITPFRNYVEQAYQYLATIQNLSFKADSPLQLSVHSGVTSTPASTDGGNLTLQKVVAALNNSPSEPQQQPLDGVAIVTANQMVADLLADHPSETTLLSVFWSLLGVQGSVTSLREYVRPYLENEPAQARKNETTDPLSSRLRTGTHATFYSLTETFNQVRQALAEVLENAPDPAEDLLQNQLKLLRSQLQRKVSLAEVAIAIYDVPLLKPNASLIKPPPALEIPVMFDLPGQDTESTYPGDFIFPITVQVTLKRNKDLVASDLVAADTPDRDAVQQKLAASIQTATAYLSPLVTESDTRFISLKGFAQQFQDAFPGLRLASSDNRNPSFPGDPNNPSSQSLWGIRMGQGGLTHNILEQRPHFFAPAPLTNTLMSGTVDLKIVEDDAQRKRAGYEPENKRFDAIDLNLLAQNFLQSVEDFLSPEIAIPALRSPISQKAQVDKVLKAKETLAAVISEQVKPILESSGDSGIHQAAKDALKQELKVNLAEAYAIETIVQFGVDVNNPLPVYPNIPPRLSGQASIQSARDAGTGAPISLENLDFTLSPSKISLEPNSHLTFFFNTQSPEKYEDIELNLRFNTNEVEYNIKNLPGIEGYQASDWLSFIAPPELQVTDEVITGFDQVVAIARADLQNLADDGHQWLTSDDIRRHLTLVLQDKLDYLAREAVISAIQGVTPQRWAIEDIQRSLIEPSDVELLEYLTTSPWQTRLTDGDRSLVISALISNDLTAIPLFQVTAEVLAQFDRLTQDIRSTLDEFKTQNRSWLTAETLADELTQPGVLENLLQKTVTDVDREAIRATILANIQAREPNYIGHVQIPIPLRAYPMPPSLVLQQAQLDPDAIGNDLSKVREWQYVYTYEHLDVAQDTLESDVQYNLTEVPKSSGQKAIEDSDAETLFDALVRFNQQYPSLQPSLEQLAKGIVKEVETVQNAIKNFATLVHDTASKWQSWRSDHYSITPQGVDYEINEEEPKNRAFSKEVTIVAPVSTTLPKVVLPGYYPDYGYDLVIETSSSPTVPPKEHKSKVVLHKRQDNDYEVQIFDHNGNVQKPQSDTSWPDADLKKLLDTTLSEDILDLTNQLDPRIQYDLIHHITASLNYPFNPEPVRIENGFHSQLHRFVEKSPEQAALDPVFGESSIPDRTLIIQDRDILKHQNAWSGIWLSRNRQLVPYAKTNPLFVFQTPQVRFSNWITPLLVNSRPWDIAQLQEPEHKEQSIADHLAKLFDTVLTREAPEPYGLRLDCRYSFAVATVDDLEDEQLFSAVPVLLTPHLHIEKGKTIDSELVEDIAQAIETWQTNNVPIKDQGRFQLALSLFSGFDNKSTLPLLKIENLFIKQTDIK